MLLSVVTLPTIQADEHEMPEPQAIVKAASDDMLQALQDNKVELEQDPSVIYGLVQDIIMPYFDFGKMSKLALGKNWRNANELQRERFTEEFRLLLVRTYSTAMLEYADEEIRMKPFHDDLSKKKVKVGLEIIQPGGPSIPMTLSMYLNKAEEWKVFDVKIDGISLITVHRKNFSTQIRNDGMDKFIDDIAIRNEKIKA
ncbi:MAG: ABC transporter substrate-binding protein [Gammaproteobacteria bacterium]|nr:MAG: ABC transporter substrate-binding protein [Gammaproteobacteria bacterium]RKZ95046.1 MAG: ABC transporter substrate-binding protein [Gammaproteobacteria bacterium]RKZ98027.1 MAG: ABC transporter substrate-binding protein [Gammaproteobacteria bacterium]RLA01404.1 MAG: ABC transporter substrate-binding protein [Gammaproteobacteria bacterium]HHA18211.1 ABC transporter substrate-binding protein [Methylophaga sp.]